MLPHLSISRNIDLCYGRKLPAILPKMPPKYTIDDWDFNNKVKFQISQDQQKLVERLENESKRVIDQVTETTQKWQNRVEYDLKGRAAEIKFLCDELKKQKKAAVLENEMLNVYRARVGKFNDFVKEKSLPICKQCMVWREDRIGVDLCIDEVDRELCKELKTITNSEELLDRTYKEATEQIRLLRSAIILSDLDLERKDKALAIDEGNVLLKDTQLNLGENVDLNINYCLYSLSEWEQQTYRNMEGNAKELASASTLHVYIDLILSQVLEDIRKQTERTNQAFERRIKQVKNVKRLLEDKHNQTMASIMDVDQTIKMLESEIGKKDRAILLCRVRLSNRGHRPGMELTCDLVQDSLYNELGALESTMCKLKQKVDENKALKRYLLHVQIMQEEEINVKANDIKIDEVDCMTLRQALVYNNY